MTIKMKAVHIITMGVIAVVSMPVSTAFLLPLAKTSISNTVVEAAARTILHYRDTVEDAEAVFNGLNSQQIQSQSDEQQPHKTGVQMGVIRTLAMSQTLALAGATAAAAMAMTLTGHPLDLNSIHWNGSENFRPLFDIVRNNGWRVVEGILAAVPVIYASSQVESANQRDLSQVNFSTISKCHINHQ